MRIDYRCGSHRGIIFRVKLASLPAQVGDIGFRELKLPGCLENVLLHRSFRTSPLRLLQPVQIACHRTKVL